MDLSGETPVTLIIKAPNQRMADQSVDCMLGWTITKLKQHLETVYPSKPKHTEQRLIYSGRLLQDHLTLKEVLRQYDSTFTSEHTLHLVCSTVMDSSTSAMPFSSQNVTAPSSNGNPPGTNGHIDSNSRNVNPTDGVRYRGYDQAAKQTSTPGPSSAQSPYSVHQTGGAAGDMTSSYPGYPYTPEQYAWMMQQQQVYSQYMMQYMQYYQNVFAPGQSFNPLAASLMQQSAAANSAPQQQPQVQEAPAANGAPGGDRPNVRMNAQGGVEEEDEEGEPRDWLHHAYFFMRFLTFMAILFFYSSLSRFCVVFCGCFVVYILQRFRNYLQRAYREQEQQRQQQQNNQQNNQQQQQAQEEPEGPGVRNGEDSGGEQDIVKTKRKRQKTMNVTFRPRPSSDKTTDAKQRYLRFASVVSSEEGLGRNGQESVPPAEPATQQDQQQQTTGENIGQTTRIFVFICNTVQAFFTSLIPTPPELLQQN